MELAFLIVIATIYVVWFVYDEIKVERTREKEENERFIFFENEPVMVPAMSTTVDSSTLESEPVVEEKDRVIDLRFL